ncbi:M3 family metallopeptidase [Streptomyces sp. NPDC006458]|uniref:M3 family metallopeptidase n=1 Tax=Streptomyces sp. NPDC006458 TaxID=3154302 RepID=UPI0033A9AEE4
MSVDPVLAPDRQSLSVMEEALESMMKRLRDVVAEPRLTQETLIEVTSIYNNVAYIFLYLEANDEFVNFERLLPWRDGFHKDPDLDRRILEMLLDLRCPDPEAEESRQAYVAQLRAKTETKDTAVEEELESLLQQAKEVLDHVQRDQAGLLQRLGTNTASGSPSVVFYKLSSQVSSAGTRRKLARAWQSARDTHLPPMLDLVDRMIAARRRARAAEGHRSVLAETFTKCGVREADVAVFLERYVERAVVAQGALEAEIRQLCPDAGDAPLDHFAHCVRTATSAAKPPMFALDDCLDYIFTVARRVFGLTLTRGTPNASQVLTVAVSSEHGEVGHINFDLWDTGNKTVGANHTKGIRNRTDWSGVVQRPVAYVSCRFRRGADGAGLITFQNMHSLFHEFGHAVNHLLIRKRISNRSGLEYLPLERLEYLSMWFEKWAYHPDLAQYLSLTPAAEEGLALCRRIKMVEYRRTYLERAVLAALDFDVHRRGEGGLEASFRQLDERFGVGRHCALGDFPGYFTWPMFVANPGANFAYLFGAADSAQKFGSFHRTPLAELTVRQVPPEMFTPCFDFDAPTPLPDSEALFAFYDTARLYDGTATGAARQARDTDAGADNDADAANGVRT